jgi:GTP cyclohydrolase I
MIFLTAMSKLMNIENNKRFLVDVGMRNLPFPIRAISKVNPEGQFTIANISITARIMQKFEARWIDKFIQIVHQHRDRIGTKTLKGNIIDYLTGLNATKVEIGFEYPFFIEKLTPVSKEMCLVQYLCTYTSVASLVIEEPTISFIMSVPVITTYPGSAPGKPGGLFGQLSIITVRIETKQDFYPEDLLEIVDRHALAPIYSFLTETDQTFIIEKIHTVEKTSVVMTDEIKSELAHRRDIERYSVQCDNFGMLHSYSTVIRTEKSRWVPWSGHEEEI